MKVGSNIFSCKSWMSVTSICSGAWMTITVDPMAQRRHPIWKSLHDNNMPFSIQYYNTLSSERKHGKYLSEKIQPFVKELGRQDGGYKDAEDSQSRNHRGWDENVGYKICTFPDSHWTEINQVEHVRLIQWTVAYYWVVKYLAIDLLHKSPIHHNRSVRYP